MNEPQLSNDGNCPRCSSADWKLAKLIVLAGITNVDTESNGGGFGIGAGGGGLRVNYQGLDLSTTGTHTNATAVEYAAPIPPAQYSRKDYWIKECWSHLDALPKALANIDNFSTNMEGITPPTPIFGGPSIESDAWLMKSKDNFIEARSQLLGFLAYERKKTLWERTRICHRCGESFVTADDRLLAKDSFNVPDLSFEGQDRRCPQCKSYQWKKAEVFFAIKIRELEAELNLNRERLRKAEEYANNPNEGGFFTRLGNRLLTPTPKAAQDSVNMTESKLRAAIGKRDQEMQQRDYQNARACSQCETIYTLVGQAANSIAQPRKSASPESTDDNSAQIAEQNRRRQQQIDSAMPSD